MLQAPKAMIAVCGLDCGGCDIRLVPTDAQAAERVVAWFHEMAWLQAGEGVAEAPASSSATGGAAALRVASRQTASRLPKLCLRKRLRAVVRTLAMGCTP